MPDGALAVDSCRGAAARLLVLIFSRPNSDGEARRRALRLGWAGASSVRCAVAFRFMLGDVNATRESDLVRLPVAEGYDSLSKKVLAGMAWAVEHSSFEYLLKTDDDSFVCVGGVMRWLAATPRGTATPGVYGGVRLSQRCVGKELVPLFRQLAHPRLRDSGCRRGWRFPSVTMHGAGYVLSHDLVRQIVRRAKLLDPIPSAEDVSISLLLHWRDRDNASHEPSLRRRVAFRPRELGVLPFASRANPWRLAERKPSDERQGQLLRERCRRRDTMVLHKLSAEQVLECSRNKIAVAAGCDHFGIGPSGVQAALTRAAGNTPV